jgi:hypothetical protein
VTTYEASPADLIAKLRATDEDDIVAALENSYVADTLHGIAPVVLLELFNNVLDLKIGPRGEDD